MVALSRRGRRPNGFVVAIFLAWFLNFAAFAIISGFIGGDALSGHIVDGHYYLRSHGKLTEVSREVFTYSLWHAGLTIVCFILVCTTLIFSWIFTRLTSLRKT